MLRVFCVGAMLASPSLAHAMIVTKKVSYVIDKDAFEGVLVHDDAAGPRPGLVLIPNWLGVTDANIKQAELVASRGYVVFVADMFGVGKRPATTEQAGLLAGALRQDRPLMRKRVVKALDVLIAQPVSLERTKLGAIGFCFGGTAALELARSGANVTGVVSFHGGLSSPTPADAKNIKAKVLVLHGADDPHVPPTEVSAFEQEMRRGKVDWQLVAYGNAVHSFTDVDANMPGKAQYNALVARRSYEAMDRFFAEAFGASP